MKQLIIIILAIFSLSTFAQQNGDIVLQTSIQNTDELTEYIKKPYLRIKQTNQVSKPYSVKNNKTKSNECKSGSTHRR